MKSISNFSISPKLIFIYIKLFLIKIKLLHLKVTLVEMIDVTDMAVIIYLLHCNGCFHVVAGIMRPLSYISCIMTAVSGKITIIMFAVL